MGTARRDDTRELELEAELRATEAQMEVMRDGLRNVADQLDAAFNRGWEECAAYHGLPHYRERGRRRHLRLIRQDTPSGGAGALTAAHMVAPHCMLKLVAVLVAMFVGAGSLARPLSAHQAAPARQPAVAAPVRGSCPVELASSTPLSRRRRIGHTPRCQLPSACSPHEVVSPPDNGTATASSSHQEVSVACTSGEVRRQHTGAAAGNLALS